MEAAIEVQGLRVDAELGRWNRGDRTLYGHQAVFEEDGLLSLREMYPELAITCEVYDDSSMLVYTTEVSFT